jgi:cobalt-zinc-cadmium efflux system membrane fusion protein
LVERLFKALPTAVALLVIGVGWLGIHHVLNQEMVESESEGEAAEPQQVADVIELPPGKIRSGQFRATPAEKSQIVHTHTVPGRLRYVETQHVEVKAPLDGILKQLLVTPGDQVESGQLIAVLQSPEIAQARGEILRCRRARDLAAEVYSRKKSLQKNLNEMMRRLEQADSVDSIEEEFSGKKLGGYRQQILSAYSNLRLAEDLADQVRPLVASGSVPGRTLREREAKRQLAKAEFQTACDEAEFAVDQEEMKASSELAAAEQDLEVARQALATLLGSETPVEPKPGTSKTELASLEVRAPFAGSVESRMFAPGERISQDAAIVVLANTDTLYVEASVRDDDWPMVRLQPGATIRVRIPAMPGQEFPAEVKYVGREVRENSNSVPLVAVLKNPKGLLRPGMFVRVTVPVEQARSVLSVDSRSVMRHEDEEFVFVQQSPNQFRRVPIETGTTSDETVEVVRGLTDGQLVVSEGAFLLKSEWLLRSEAE